MSNDFVILDWAAWAPGLSSRDHWQQWQLGEKPVSCSLSPPILTSIPKTLQRRLSPLARAVLYAVGECITEGEAIPSVFSSSHGEISRCLHMLETLQAGDELSPTAFSLSVHNAIAGLFSMAYGNRAEITALAPAVGGIHSGFIEALGILAEGHPDVLLVFYDEPLPDFFPNSNYAMTIAFPCVLALRLASQGAGMNLQFNPVSSEQEGGEQPIQLLAFIQFLLGDLTELHLGDYAHGWLWQKR